MALCRRPQNSRKARPSGGRVGLQAQPVGPGLAPRPSLPASCGTQEGMDHVVAGDNMVHRPTGGRISSPWFPPRPSRPGWLSGTPIERLLAWDFDRAIVARQDPLAHHIPRQSVTRAPRARRTMPIRRSSAARCGARRPEAHRHKDDDIGQHPPTRRKAPTRANAIVVGDRPRGFNRRDVAATIPRTTRELSPHQRALIRRTPRTETSHADDDNEDKITFIRPCAMNGRSLTFKGSKMALAGHPVSLPCLVAFPSALT